MDNMKSRILGERKKLSQNTQTTEAQEQKPKSLIRKLATAMIIASVAALSTQTLLPPVYAADATQAAIQMVQTKYSIDGVQQANYKLSVDGVDKSSALTFKVQNSRSMIGLRSFSEILGAQVDWDAAHKVALVTKGSTKIEVPIGSPTILVNGTPKPVDDQGTISIIVDSSTYLPFRIIAESLGYTVGYDSNTKTITVTSGSGQQQQPPTDAKIDLTYFYNKKNPDGTNFNPDVINRIYNSLKEGNLTDQQIQTILETVKSTPPTTSRKGAAYNKYRESLNYDEISSYTPPNPQYEETQSMYYMMPANAYYHTDAYPGIYWNGNNWEHGADIYFGL